jgi:hypothetical protein
MTWAALVTPDQTTDPKLNTKARVFDAERYKAASMTLWKTLTMLSLVDCQWSQLEPIVVCKALKIINSRRRC